MIVREKNCGNCNNCVSSSATRFRCQALPVNPSGGYWDGNPINHWCATYWTQKIEDVKSAVKIPSKKDV